MLVDIPKEDYEFLKELQNELNTQDTDGNAQPVFWSVLEDKEVFVPDYCGDYQKIIYDDGDWTLEEAVEEVNSNISDYDETIQKAWDEIDKTDIWCVYDFMTETMGIDNLSLYDVCKENYISRTTGAFLTKRACKNYIEKYAYNHNNPRTYAMTAYRNFELERLLKILKTIKF